MRRYLLAAMTLGFCSAAIAQPSDATAGASSALNLSCEGEWWKSGGTVGRSGDGRVRLKLDGAQGTVQLPEALSAPSRNSVDGWIPLQDLVIADEQITAKIRFNMIASARIEIDRTNGVLNFSGSPGNFEGDCRPYDPAVLERAF